MDPEHAPTGIEAIVCADIAHRQQLGIAKYGCTVAESTDNMLQHAYEEALDLAVYLRAEIARRRAICLNCRGNLPYCSCFEARCKESGSNEERDE